MFSFNPIPEVVRTKFSALQHLHRDLMFDTSPPHVQIYSVFLILEDMLEDESLGYYPPQRSFCAFDVIFWRIVVVASGFQRVTYAARNLGCVYVSHTQPSCSSGIGFFLDIQNMKWGKSFSKIIK